MDNERIAKKLGWRGKNIVGEWYVTPNGQRTPHPPQFDTDWELWHGPRGALAILAEDTQVWRRFCVRVSALATPKRLAVTGPTDVADAALKATPQQLSEAMIGELGEETCGAGRTLSASGEKT